MLGALVFLVFGTMGKLQFLQLEDQVPEEELLEEASDNFLEVSTFEKNYGMMEFLQQSLSTLVVVSDSSHQVLGPDVATTSNAVACSNQANSPIPGASWIWDAPVLNNPTLNQTVIITKDFGVKTPPTKGTIVVYASDIFTLKVNCQVVTCQASVVGSTPVPCDITSFLIIGNNHLEFSVTKIGSPNYNPQNPTGLLYQITVTYPPLAPIPNPANPPLIPISYANSIVVSDTTNQASGPDVTGTVNAVVSTAIQTSPIPGAFWIWDAPLVGSSTLQQTVVISKAFTIYGVPSKGVLSVYVTYQFSLKINGLPTSCQATNSVYTSLVTCDITSSLVTGYNVLVFTVTNKAVSGSTPQQNPAGLLYQLSITYPVASLVVVSDTTNQVSGPDVTGTVNAVVSTSLGGSPLTGASWIWDAQ
jgi:hypothetical protein